MFKHWLKQRKMKKDTALCFTLLDIELFGYYSTMSVVSYKKMPMMHGLRAR